MKLRLGFVSNSSSLSFVLDKEGLTEQQITAIRKWCTKARTVNEDHYINETDKHFFGQMSYHNDPSLASIMDKLDIAAHKLDIGD